MNTSENSCKNQWERFLNKDFRSWQGLSPDCRLAFWDSLYQLQHLPEGNILLGSGKHPAKFRTVKTDQYEEPVYFYSSDNSLLKISVEYPETDFRELRKLLGDAPLKLDYYWDVVKIREGEWVYPENGIALNLNPEKDAVIKISVFAPLSAQEYREKLFYSEPPREMPYRE